MKRTNENKGSIILYQPCSAAGENSGPVRDFRRLLVRESWSLMYFSCAML